ncbi:MAG: HlyD family efflux transporter periplasmic adaptor subunit [Parvularculaceae bacterium]
MTDYIIGHITGRMKRLAAIFLLTALAGCTDKPPTTLTGYVESELLYLAPQDAGLIAEVAVREGDAVSAGDLLFRLDPARAGFSAEQAQAAARGAAARAGDNGALIQQIAEAEAALDIAQRSFDRTRELLKDGVITKARYDADTSTLAASEARLERARAERAAALQEWEAANAAANLAGRRLADLETRAPADGVIERVYRRAGEVAALGDPVVSLLPPENLKLRFFAPEKFLARYSVGQQIRFSCDGCADGLTARVSYIASEPQFTPPVIYSLEEREKFVFLIEARIDAGAAVRSGLPVTVEIPQ